MGPTVDFTILLVVFILITLLAAIICSLLDNITYKLEKEDTDDGVELGKLLKEYNEKHPKKKG